MKDLTWIKEKLIAHRGFHSKDKTIPENSLKAFELAIEKDAEVWPLVQLHARPPRVPMSES